MLTTVFILLLIMNALADKKEHNTSTEKESNSSLKFGKKFGKEFAKNVTSKISKNRLLMSHILLRTSLNENFSKTDFFEDDLSRKGRDDLMQDIVKPTSRQDRIKTGNESELQSQIPHQIQKQALLNMLLKPMYLPIIIQRSVPMPMLHPLAMNYPFGGNIFYQRSPLCFISPLNYPNIC